MYVAYHMDTVDPYLLLVSNIVFAVLFLLSEIIGSSSCDENGVIEIITKRFSCIPSQTIRINST